MGNPPKKYVRNSEAIDLLLKIVVDSRFSWFAVELAGRGIAADTASNKWMVDVGKRSVKIEALGDALMEGWESLEAYGAAWQDFNEGVISEAEFESRLARFVLDLEGWIARSGRAEYLRVESEQQ